MVINSRTAPIEGRRLLAEALANIGSASGLRFEVEATTEERPSPDRAAFQPDRYGDRWAPVLVAWSEPAELSELTGEVAGIGGSTSIEHRDGQSVYVSGVAYLDGPQLAGILERDNGWAEARSVIEHELGHLVGLGHVDDPDQLMHPTGSPRVTGPKQGDLAGLSRLGAGPCFEEL